MTAQEKQRYRCHTCARQFQHAYQYRACVPGVRAQIVTLTLNGAGIRDITCVLGVSLNTVLKTLRGAAAALPSPVLPARDRT